MSGSVIAVIVPALKATLFVFEQGLEQVFYEGFVSVFIIVRVYLLTIDGHFDRLEEGVQLVFHGHGLCVCVQVISICLGYSIGEVSG